MNLEEEEKIKKLLKIWKCRRPFVSVKNKIFKPTSWKDGLKAPFELKITILKYLIKQ